MGARARFGRSYVEAGWRYATFAFDDADAVNAVVGTVASWRPAASTSVDAVAFAVAPA